MGDHDVCYQNICRFAPSSKRLHRQNRDFNGMFGRSHFYQSGSRRYDRTQKSVLLSRVCRGCTEMVPRVGLEPTRGCPHQHLKLARLPVPPPRQRILWSKAGSSVLHCGLDGRLRARTLPSARWVVNRTSKKLFGLTISLRCAIHGERLQAKCNNSYRKKMRSWSVTDVARLTSTERRRGRPPR